MGVPVMQRWLLQLMLVSGLSAIAIAAARPMVTYRALELGASPVGIGLIASSFSALALLAALPLGRWMDRADEGRFLVAGTVLVAAASFAMVLTDSLVGLAISHAALGLGHVTNLIAGQSMVANRTAAGERDQRFGTYSTVASLGQMIGPAVAAVLVTITAASVAAVPAGSPNHQAAAFMLSGLCALTATAAAVGFRRSDIQMTTGRTPQRESAPLAAVRMLRRPGMLSAMLVSVIVISSIDVLVAYLPAFGDANGLPVALVGALLALRAGASMTSRLIMGRLIRVLGRRALLTFSMGTAGLGLLLLPFAPVPVLVVLMALVGFGLGVGQPMTMAWVADQSLPGESATSLGIRLAGNRAALIVAPTIVGAIGGAVGLAGIFAAVAMALGGGAAVAARAPLSKSTDHGDPVD